MPLHMDTAMRMRRGLTDAKLAYQPTPSGTNWNFALVYIAYRTRDRDLTNTYHTARTSLEVQACITVTHYEYNHPFIFSLTSTVEQMSTIH